MSDKRIADKKPDSGKSKLSRKFTEADVTPAVFGFADLVAAQQSIHTALIAGTDVKDHIDRMLAHNAAVPVDQHLGLPIRIKSLPEQVIVGYAVDGVVKSVLDITPLDIFTAGMNVSSFAAFMRDNDLNYNSPVTVVTLNPRLHQLLKKDEDGDMALDMNNPTFRLVPN